MKFGTFSVIDIFNMTGGDDSDFGKDEQVNSLRPICARPNLARAHKHQSLAPEHASLASRPLRKNLNNEPLDDHPEEDDFQAGPLLPQARPKRKRRGERGPALRPGEWPNSIEYSELYCFLTLLTL